MSIDVLNAVADKILGISLPHTVRVGINGVDGSGKTFFAKSLVDTLRSRTDRQVIAATIDRFHHPRAHRYLRGRDSAEGYYQDSFRYQTLRDALLVPLGAGGDRKYTTEVFDHRSDTAVSSPSQIATDDAILILEGIFIFRPELASELDYKVYIDVPFEVALQRMLKRDKDVFASEEEAVEMFHKRYKAGQELYMTEVDPKAISDLVVDNADFKEPKIVTDL